MGSPPRWGSSLEGTLSRTFQLKKRSPGPAAPIFVPLGGALLIVAVVVIGFDAKLLDDE